MKILVAFECSGIVREAFRRTGHSAMSCDLKPTETQGWHRIGDVRDVLGDGWDMLIAHPPCTYLSSSGLHWNNRGRGHEQTYAALALVRLLMDAPIERICIENPQGCIGTRIRPATQFVQPYQFGHDASKKTGLWLKNLPPLRPTQFVEPRMVEGKPRWANQTDSGQNRLTPSPTRAADRSRTYPGIATAMAAQWGAVIAERAAA